MQFAVSIHNQNTVVCASSVCFLFSYCLWHVWQRQLKYWRPRRAFMFLLLKFTISGHLYSSPSTGVRSALTRYRLCLFADKMTCPKTCNSPHRCGSHCPSCRDTEESELYSILILFAWQTLVFERKSYSFVDGHL